MIARRTVMAGAAALAGLASLRTSALPRARATFRIPVYSETIFFLPLWIAQEKGFYDRFGLDVTFEKVPSIGMATASLLSGANPIGMLAPEVPFHDLGGPNRAVIIAGNANRPPHFLIAQRRFKQVADLRGATFGAISLTEGTTFLFQQMAAAAGLSPSDYRIAAVGSAPERVRLMDEGRIDAALQPFPLSYEAEAKGFSNLGWVGTVEPDWQFSVTLANRVWLADHREVAARFLAGTLLGRRFMEEDRAGAAAIAAPRIRTTPQLARRALDEALDRQIMYHDLRWSGRGLQRQYEILQRAGAVPAARAFRLSDYCDPLPLARAQRLATLPA